MPKIFKVFVSVIIIFIVAIGIFVLSYLGFLNKTNPPRLVDLPQIIENKVNTPTEVNFKIEEVVNNLDVPWGIVFTSEDRALVTERDGRIRIIQDETLLEKPLYTFSDVSSKNEEGLMGIALSPNYSENKLFYVCYAYAKNGVLLDKIVKLKDNTTSAEVETIVLDNIPAAQFHAGCRTKFGPDGKLYVTTGDAGEKDNAQDINSLSGKILRLNEDGTIPTDNPYSNYVYSLGHRNSQGIAWNFAGDLYSTEHGPSLIDGPAGGDEINKIVKGKNYGWPLVSHEKSQKGLEDPLTIYTPAVAPASAMIYSGKMFPQFKENLFFGALRGEGLFRVLLDNEKGVLGSGKIEDVNFGRIRDVVEAPNGEIWFSTSNKDGRGNLNPNDDKIYRITKL